jgi:hypothetical protein
MEEVFSVRVAKSEKLVTEATDISGAQRKGTVRS